MEIDEQIKEWSKIIKRNDESLCNEEDSENSQELNSKLHQLNQVLDKVVRSDKLNGHDEIKHKLNELNDNLDKVLESLTEDDNNDFSMKRVMTTTTLISIIETLIVLLKVI